MSLVEDCRANWLLASLPAADFARMAPLLKPVTLQQGAVLYFPGDEVEHVYFPCSGIVSHAVMLKDGKTIETAMVGRESAVGALAGLGEYRPHTRATVQLPLTAWRISAAGLRPIVQASQPLCELIRRGVENLLMQAQVTAACNALHSLEQRLARWILQAHELGDGESVRLTQEVLSQALGVTRSSVSEAAGKLQAQGMIHYTRGSIEVTDGPGLEAAACECCGVILRRMKERPSF